jgi:serine/threonine protein kinase
MGAMIPLGPFLLDQPIGRGGMGTVWSAKHATQGVPVAVKLVTHRGGPDPHRLDAFRNEIRAVARLHHPNIILVVDHGVVDEAASRAAKGRVVAGSPYLAMELVSGGTLATSSPGDWPAVRR